MPIRKVAPTPRKSAVKAGSTYDGIGGDVKIDEQSEFDLENNMGPSDMLIDPPEDEGGSLYTGNLEKADTATAPKTKKVKAGTDQQNVGTLPNDEDPAAGYLPQASEFDTDATDGQDTIDGEIDEEVEDGEVIADTLVNNDQAEQLVVANEDDWDAEPDNADDDIELPADDADTEVSSTVLSPEDSPICDDEMTMLDVDEVADNDSSNLTFAAAGTNLLVIKANRVIATMSESLAKSTGREDIYLSDQFMEVTASEIRSKGLRAGLKEMGLVEARVKVGGSAAVKSLVKKEVTKTTAAVRSVAAAKADAMDQSLAIAAVGINRGYFAKQSNVLREAIESMLTTAGMRHAKRALNPIFSSVGPEYTKQVLTLAQKIAAMPQEARDGYIEALDLTSDDIDEPDEDVVPIGALTEDDGDDDFADVEPATLATAGVARKRSVVQAGSMSVLASSILNGSAPLF